MLLEEALQVKFNLEEDPFDSIGTVLIILLNAQSKTQLVIKRSRVLNPV